MMEVSRIHAELRVAIATTLLVLAVVSIPKPVSAQDVVINNGLAPPNPENVVSFPFMSPIHVIVNNFGCDATVEYPCVSPGGPTAVEGLVQTISLFETSTFEGQVGRQLTARDASSADVIAHQSASVYAYDSSNLIVEGYADLRFYTYDNASLTIEECEDYCDVTASGHSSVVARAGFEHIAATDQSHVILSGGGVDGSRISVRDDALLEFYGRDSYSLSVSGGVAILHPRSNITYSFYVGEAGTVELRGGSVDGRVGNQVAGTLVMSGGLLRRSGFIVSGYAVITGGSVVAESAPSQGRYGRIPGPWNFIATGRGLIDLYGASLNQYVSLGARERSTIRIHGTGFAVDGVPVRYGLIKKPTGKLSGVLQSGDPIDNAFGHRGADCDGVACTGKIMLMPPRHRRN